MSPVRLRPTTSGDLDWVLAAEGDAENRPYVTQWTRRQHQETLDDADRSHCIVESLEDGRAVGYVIVAGLAPPCHDVELRRIVVTEKGRGFGRAALRLVKRLVLDDARTRRLWLDVRANNPRARSLYEAEGFVAEGTDPEGLTVLSIVRAGTAAETGT